ncbi:MAG: CRISPR-associated protein Cas4 [Promethearchaeota archaeon]
MNSTIQNWFVNENERKNQSAFTDDWMVSAEEIRQYLYCPRIPFFRKIRQIKPRTTKSMQRGTEFHKNVVHKRKMLQKWLEIHDKSLKNQKIELDQFNQPNQLEASKPEYYFNLYLESPNLHLLAYLDLIESNISSDEIYPVEFKSLSRLPKNQISIDFPVATHHLVQLTVQSLLMEEQFQKFISKAKIMYIAQDQVQTCWQEISIDMKELVLKTVRKMHEEIISEDLPVPTKHKKKCTVCEYRQVCRSI